ncbi:MAG TPA: hypothetical protein DD458_02830 [Prolixibacteraceae bacterium]|nr:hypothetical protein [Prolixibacteraceae bacterium]HCR90596.1 hypothetical protein [Prolixibacteraceae bacterium]HCU63671.1 hypothetical protein [Prolixibacteraceae bacterium]
MNLSNKLIRRNPEYLSRRGFISSCTVCGACMAISPLLVFGNSTNSSVKDEKMKIRVIYSLHAPIQPKLDWPNIGFDFNPYIDN